MSRIFTIFPRCGARYLFWIAKTIVVWGSQRKGMVFAFSRLDACVKLTKGCLRSGYLLWMDWGREYKSSTRARSSLVKMTLALSSAQ